MKVGKQASGVAILALLLYGCGQPGTSENTATTPPPASAQAVFKTQTGPFVLAEKAEVKSEYNVQTKLIVPQDLAPQNKWVMFEGPVLENELIAYRFYLDSRHRSDIFEKKRTHWSWTRSVGSTTTSWTGVRIF
ncbi:MAG: DUF4861 family protein [Saprospiraceae bacterium]